MGTLATVVYKYIATLLFEKRGQSYSKTLYWLRCKLGFSLLHSAVACLRGLRSSYHHYGSSETTAIDLICAEGRLDTSD